MNSIAEFVYRIASQPDRRRFYWSIAGAAFWYGAVVLMIVLSPWLDESLGSELSIPSAVRFPIAVVLLVVGVPVVLLTIWHFLRIRGTPIPFNPPPKLVTGGLYGIIRNPMHLGWTIVLIGLAVLLQSFTLLVIFIPIFILVHVLYLKFVEEKELGKKFGQAYLDYKKRVPMFIPRVGYI